MNKKLLLIQDTKEAVEELSNQQDELWNDLLDELCIDDNAKMKDCVFDYVYNNTQHVWHYIEKEFADE